MRQNKVWRPIDWPKENRASAREIERERETAMKREEIFVDWLCSLRLCKLWCVRKKLKKTRSFW